MKPSSRQQTIAAAAAANSPPLSSATDALAALTPILDAFNHRHRNQHHSSHWWPVFRILRRAVRALTVDLIFPPSAVAAASPSRRPHRDTSPPHPPPRARWLDAHVVPRAYVAFTQLAADNQHAPLGLMLLAVLARTHTILSDLLPEKDSTSLYPQQPPKSKPQPPGHQSAAVGVEETPGIGRGVSVSRQQLLSAQYPPPSVSVILPFKPDSDRKQDREKEKKEKNKKKKKKKKKGNGDELASLFDSLA